MTAATENQGADRPLGVLVRGDSDTARDLALRLGIPLLQERPATAGLMLELDDAGLALVDTDPSGPGPVRVDFADARLQHRLRGAGPRREAVARAVGLPGRPELEVVDATGGLGRDAFVLASLGARVQVLERNPVVFELLHDGWRRAMADRRTAEAAGRLTLVQADAETWLGGLISPPDAVYLDPMYPADAKGGEVKKGMRTLQRLLGAEPDPQPLFEAAWRARPQRLVIKRPRHAAVLRPDQRKFTLEGRHTRFDVYLVTEALGESV